MARQDNSFALLGYDDEGGDDVVDLLAKVEAKISPFAPAAEQPQPNAKPGAPAGFPSKSPPPSEHMRGERGRGRGGRGRGPGRGGFGQPGGNTSSDGFNGESFGQFGNSYSRDLGGDSGGQGRGCAGGRGRRGRERGRGYYGERGFSNENNFDAGKENQVQGGNWLESRTEVQLDENREPSNETMKAIDEKKGSGWEEKGYGGENRRFMGGEGREGRGFGTGRGGRGGNFRRYNVRDGAGDGRSGGKKGSQEKQEASDVNVKAANAVVADVVPTGWDAPETADVPKVAESIKDDAEKAVKENAEKAVKEDAEKAVAEDSPEKDAEKAVAEEEDKEMTLDEYEKVLQEKRKSLQSLKNEERRVVVDKDFQSMQLVDKKKEDELFVKLKSDKDKLKKKDGFEREEKARKSVSINEFLKPAEGERYARQAARGRGGGRGRGRGERGGYSGRRDHIATVPHIGDPGQFPVLGARQLNSL